ncbi:NAD(P)H-dependent oxidoreductase [Porphyromonas pogonae]|uniref:NAD(P)H-dependent oxidoreductase n=1 Tax=Porphyromonas pogonae TaxID=867595 RepID=UPI002E7A3AFD|nr:NAD(P)H-dependent oxidoreductase [Porphyromonas pogonae]
MKTLVIITHPDLSTSVINKRWKEELDKAGIASRNLCDVYPDEKIDIEAEHQLLEQYDRIIFQYPLYWYAAPYMLKKYMDEVFTLGWAYGEGGDKMEGKEIGAAVSCGSPSSAFSTQGTQLHTLEHYLFVFDGIAAFLRSKYIGFHAFYDTYNPQALLSLADNAQEYVHWLKK